MKLRILLIDDDDILRELCFKAISQEGHKISTADSGEKAIPLIKDEAFDLVITDLKLPGISGYEILKEVKSVAPQTDVIVMTGYGDIETAVEVMKSGGYDFWVKPIHITALIQHLEKIVEKKTLERENIDLRERYEELSIQVQNSYQNLIGQSETMKKIFSIVEAIKDLDSTVLITGETGTGKELIARAIHNSGKRKDKPFIVVDNGAIPDTLLESELFGYEKGAFTSAIKKKMGRFERADTGTLFLDEINNTSLAVQQKLLRAIQERTFERLGGEKSQYVDVRIIAATNQDLWELVERGLFRKDLFYRLNVISIFVPPLRNRLEDIIPLTNYFLDFLGEKMGKWPVKMDEKCLMAMMKYSWPGNVRELRNLLERALATTPGNIILSLDIPESSPNFCDEAAKVPIDISQSLPKLVEESIQKIEKMYLIKMLKVYKGKLNQISEQSQISPKTLYRKMQDYGLEKEHFKEI